MTQTHPDLDKRPRRGADNVEEMVAQDSAGGQPDLYGMLGHRATALLPLSPPSTAGGAADRTITADHP